MSNAHWWALGVGILIGVGLVYAQSHLHARRAAAQQLEATANTEAFEKLLTEAENDLEALLEERHQQMADQILARRARHARRREVHIHDENCSSLTCPDQGIDPATPTPVWEDMVWSTYSTDRGNTDA